MSRLLDLAPRWFAVPGRSGQGVVFDCPGCRAGACADAKAGHAYRLAVAFAQPLDGGEPIHLHKLELYEAIADPGEDWPTNVVPPGVHWRRSGADFATLTIEPSIDASAAGHWHGWVRNGEAA